MRKTMGSSTFISVVRPCFVAGFHVFSSATTRKASASSCGSTPCWTLVDTMRPSLPIVAET